jgi:hypothetical protein
VQYMKFVEKTQSIIAKSWWVFHFREGQRNTADDSSRGPLTAINKTLVVIGYHPLTCSKKKVNQL